MERAERGRASCTSAFSCSVLIEQNSGLCSTQAGHTASLQLAVQRARHMLCASTHSLCCAGTQRAGTLALQHQSWPLHHAASGARQSLSSPRRSPALRGTRTTDACPPTSASASWKWPRTLWTSRCALACLRASPSCAPVQGHALVSCKTPTVRTLAGLQVV